MSWTDFKSASLLQKLMPAIALCWEAYPEGDCLYTGHSAAAIYSSNTAQWMMVPMSMVSTDGTQCNMVGTSYYGFKYAQVVRISPRSGFWWEQGGCDVPPCTCYACSTSCARVTPQYKAISALLQKPIRPPSLPRRGLLRYGSMEGACGNPKRLLWMQSPCSQPVGTCLQNQLTDLYAADVTRSTKGITPIYFVSRWGGGKAGAQQVMTAAYIILGIITVG